MGSQMQVSTQHGTKPVEESVLRVSMQEGPGQVLISKVHPNLYSVTSLENCPLAHAHMQPLLTL